MIRFQLPENRSRVLSLPAIILFEDEQRDLAFLRALRPDGKPCRLLNLKRLPLIKSINAPDLQGGEIVFIAGYPRLWKDRPAMDLPIARRGIIASTEMKHRGNPMLLLDLSGWPGYSGSPVILEKTGEVIGLVSGRPTKRTADFELATPITQADYERAMIENAALKDR
jgi:hypothetical protein